MATQITVSRVPDYSDLDLDFMRNPKTNQLIYKKGNDAIKRSIRNLLFTNTYDRKFQSYIGADIRALLFENYGPLTTLLLRDAINNTIQNFEPRVKLGIPEGLGVAAREGIVLEEDVDNNGYKVTLNYVILNTNEPIIMTMFLERIR